MTRSRLFASFAFALATVVASFACGGGSSSITAPTPTPGGLPTTFTFVNVNDMSMSADRLPLWGIRGQNTPTAVEQMVFGDVSGPSNPGLRVMSRLIGDATIVYPDGLAADKVAKLQSGAVLLQAATGYQIGVGTSPVPGTATLNVVFGPSDAGADFRPQIGPNFEMTGGTLTFRSPDDITDYGVRHELGHAFGLMHHNGFGIMSTNFDARNIVYSQMELDNMQMMLRVAPGTRFPG